jgi:prephenate dehydrogenase
MKFKQLGLIGCGLMGGSFALAMKQAGLVERIIGYSKSPSTTERARQMGVIDQAAESALLAVSGSDIVLLAVPVAATDVTFATWSTPMCCSWTWAAPSATWSTPPGAC